VNDDHFSDHRGLKMGSIYFLIFFVVKKESLIFQLLTLTFVLMFGLSARAAEVRQLAETESVDGRIRAAWQVAPAEPQLSDTIRLTLEIQAETTLQVEMPVFGHSLGELKIANISEQTIGVTGGRETKQLVLDVTAKHGGMMPIWQTPIVYSDRREGLQGKSNSITIPATEFEIKASVSPENASLEKISTSLEIFDIRSQKIVWLIALLILLIAAGIILLLIRLRRKNGTDSENSTLSPQEIALRRLALLLENRLHETDIKKFFIELTGIVRWYIEQQTDIRAPELTTEEFLHEITQHWKQRNVLPPELRDRLRLFLESADRVKFAKFQPTQDEMMLGVRRAEEFISSFAPTLEVQN
jgi:hypothetical protein